MSAAPKKVRKFLCIPLPSFGKKAPKEDIQLEKLDAKALEQQLVEERAKYARLKAEADETRGKFENEIREIKETREREVSGKDEHIQQLEKEASQMREMLAKPRPDPRVQELSTRLAEKEKLLKERTTELNAAQAFLTKVDAVSEAEVVGMVDNLNTLICSASGSLSDAWDQREPIPGTLVDESDMEQVRNDFGTLIFQQIEARDSVAVNLAIQMYLCRFIERTTASWGSGQVAGTLGDIYGMISTKESQTIASRWRTLTKRYIPHQELPQSDEIIGGLARILTVTQSFSDLSEAMDAVGASAGTEIKAIIEATVQLNDTIKTKIASSDMSVYTVSPRTVFTEGTMVDEFAEDGSNGGGEPGAVAGTMEIGLFQKIGDVEKVLRKPKVILERDLVNAEGGNNE